MTVFEGVHTTGKTSRSIRSFRKHHPNSKTWLGGSKSYTGGTTERKFRRRRILQMAVRVCDAVCQNSVTQNFSKRASPPRTGQRRRQNFYHSAYSDSSSPTRLLSQNEDAPESACGGNPFVSAICVLRRKEPRSFRAMASESPRQSISAEFLDCFHAPCVSMGSKAKTSALAKLSRRKSCTPSKKWRSKLRVPREKLQLITCKSRVRAHKLTQAEDVRGAE